MLMHCVTTRFNTIAPIGFVCWVAASFLNNQLPNPKPTMMTRERYQAAATFLEYLATVQKNQELWHGIYQRASVPLDLAQQVTDLNQHYHLVALSEDWCGDAVNLLPVVARLAEATPNVQLRVLGRDANPDLMDAHLTGTARSIPVVIVYDQAFNELGWWGPRPAELQKWVKEVGLTMDKDERYRHIRAWYARDKGRTTIQEIMGLMEGVTT